MHALSNDTTAFVSSRFRNGSNGRLTQTPIDINKGHHL